MAKLALPSKMYQLMIKTAEPMVPKKLIPLWNHPAGNSKMTIFNIAKRVTPKDLINGFA